MHYINCCKNLFLFLLPPFLPLAFLSFPSVGVKTSSHLSCVISSCPTESFLPSTITAVVPGLEQYLLHILALVHQKFLLQRLSSIVLHNDQDHEGAQHGQGFSPDS